MSHPLKSFNSRISISIYMYRACISSYKIPKALVLHGNKVMIACKRFDRTRKQPVTTNKVELENFSPANQVSNREPSISRLCPLYEGEETRGLSFPRAIMFPERHTRKSR